MEIARLNGLIQGLKKAKDVNSWLQVILTLELCIEELRKLLK